MDELHHQSSHFAAALIGSNDDLLTEILLYLPVVSIRRFKIICKQWRSLLSDTSFTRRYDTRHFYKSPLGVYTYNDRYYAFDDDTQHFYKSRGFYPFIDMFVAFNDEHQTTPLLRNLDLSLYPNGIRMLQSCNGLLLLYSQPRFSLGDRYYVFNPTTKQHVMIPPVPRGKTVQKTICFMGLAFHQRDCVYYKVVCILKLDDKHDKPIWKEELFQIQIYSSDTREWKISNESFSARLPIIGSGVYWNGAIYWALSDRSYMYFKFDVEQLHSLPLPVETIDFERLQRSLGESRGHLHLMVYVQHDHSHLPLKVYEMLMDHSGWFLKYHVQLDELRGPLEWYLPSLTNVIRGEEDEDTFIVLLVCGLFVTYNVHDKSFKRISVLNNLYEKKGVSPFRTTFHHYSQTLASI